MSRKSSTSGPRRPTRPSDRAPGPSLHLEPASTPQSLVDYLRSPLMVDGPGSEVPFRPSLPPPKLLK